MIRAPAAMTERSRAAAPLLNPLLGGEGRVRGQRHGVPQRIGRPERFPLTPALSPIGAMGEREQSEQNEQREQGEQGEQNERNEDTR